MFDFNEASGGTDARIIAAGTILAGLFPALIESKAITKEAALAIFDNAIAGLTRRQSMSHVGPALALIREWRTDLADKDI